MEKEYGYSSDTDYSSSSSSSNINRQYCKVSFETNGGNVIINGEWKEMEIIAQVGTEK